MDCIELVQRNGWIILSFLGFIGLCGVALHALWSSRLTFFRFDQKDTTNKGNLKRLIFPLVGVSILGLLTPILAAIISPEFRECLEDATIGPYLSLIWTYVLPIKGTWIGVSAAVCAFIGLIFYWIFGLILYGITK